MKVILKRHWFGPDKHLYRKSDDPRQMHTEIPGSYRDQLPKDAVVVGEVDKNEAPLPIPAAPGFRDVDEARLNEELTEEVLEVADDEAAKAEEARKEKLRAFQEQLAAEAEAEDPPKPVSRDTKAKRK